MRGLRLQSPEGVAPPPRRGALRFDPPSAPYSGGGGMQPPNPEARVPLTGSLGLTSPLQLWQKKRCWDTAAAAAAEASAIFSPPPPAPCLPSVLREEQRDYGRAG